MCFQLNNWVVNISNVSKLKLLPILRVEFLVIFLFIPNYNKGFHMNNQKSIISNSNIDSDWSIDYVSTLSPK